MFTQDSLNALDTALERFHHYREVFRIPDVRPGGFSLPRQHSLKHYRHHIENFGTPNGPCSSITESKHISAVKKPWRRSNRFEALKQMLIINTRNDKLAAMRVDFASRGMLSGTCLGEAIRLFASDPSGNEDEPSSQDGIREVGRDLDLDNDDGGDNNGGDDNDGDDNDGGGGNNNDIPPGPVDRPLIFSEVTLTLRRGMCIQSIAVTY